MTGFSLKSKINQWKAGKIGNRGHIPRAASQQVALWMEHTLCSSPKNSFFTPLPERPGSCQGWIPGRTSEPKGQTCWRVYGFSIAMVEEFGRPEYWGVSGGVERRTPGAECLRMSLLRQHRGTMNDGPGWGELILTPFDISYSSKLRIFNCRPKVYETFQGTTITKNEAKEHTFCVPYVLIWQPHTFKALWNEIHFGILCYAGWD